jgi:hypothetical protein
VIIQPLFSRLGLLLAISLPLTICAPSLRALQAIPDQLPLTQNWELADSANVKDAGPAISLPGYHPAHWYPAVVPGTVLTTLVHAGVYPEPLYGENNRPDRIPESLNKASYWYRTTFVIPASYSGRQVWLNFDGINYSADIWLNGHNIGKMLGAFKRGNFNVTPLVKPGQRASLAVLITPQPHPGIPHEHTIADGLGANGGITAIDGPTFLSTIGWDWIPAIRDRDSGIWQQVYLSATGPVTLRDPLVTTDLPLPRTDSADIAISATLENVSDTPLTASLRASFGTLTVEQLTKLAPHSSQIVSLTPKEFSTLHLDHPRLWWPNGYGPQNLYTLHLTAEVVGQPSDEQTLDFGVRKISYSVPDSDNLTVSVNGVRIFLRGGDWGLDEALKRIPRERLDAEIHLHQLANMNIIRNWVGQSTNEDFYQLCDKYGILLWDEFFQPNPSDGPNPTDLPTYMANVRDKILRFRNHPSIAIWCARNEGFPPKEIDDQLRILMAELEPTRLYQPSSTSGHGVNSGGPYWWRTPREYYSFDEAFKTEIGSSSIPTIESLQGMMPQKDWEQINDDWAEHDLARGASHGDTYPATLAARYGKLANMADFVRKSQLANYEAFRAMYEGRNAKLFNPSTAVITWMSNPAQPSFVWQIYHHDLEPNSSLFAVKKAGEMVHIQFNEANGSIEVINNLPTGIAGAKALVTVYSLDGAETTHHQYSVTGPASTAIDLGTIDGSWTWEHPNLSPVHFIQMQLHDASGRLLSDNFYWRSGTTDPDNLQPLNEMKHVVLTASATRSDAGGKLRITVVLHNPAKEVALMAHLQLRRRTAAGQAGERVLPVYYSDNYLSLVSGESKTITVDVDSAQLHGELPFFVLDGWNTGVEQAPDTQIPVEVNTNAQVDHYPTSGIPIVAHTWKPTN